MMVFFLNHGLPFCDAIMFYAKFVKKKRIFDWLEISITKLYVQNLVLAEVVSGPYEYSRCLYFLRSIV